MDYETSAAALYNGGWRAGDRDDLREWYNLNEIEAEKLAEKLKEFEEDENMAKIIEYWDQLVELMDDDIRVAVHNELAPCTDEAFLSRYLELDPDFMAVIEQIA